jgi:hypothetical protein
VSREGSGADTAPAVYWFWDQIPDRARARAQVREMAAAGIGRVMIQARLALPRETYLSPEYLRGYRDAVEAAGEAGLRVTVYDEYNWMSGHGGGRTVDGADHLRERHLFWSTAVPGGRARAAITGIRSDWLDSLGAAGRTWIYEDGRRRFDEWQIVAAGAHPPSGGEPTEVVELTPWATCAGRADGCVAQLSAGAPVPDGWAVTFFLSARCASSRAINYLDRAAAERFLSVVYDPYRHALDGLIGDPVDGFSFDHPYGGFYRWREWSGQVLNSLMWHDPARLAEERTLSPAQLLFAVIHGTGPASQVARCRFFARYSARAIDSFFGTLRDWATTHGVGLTGHELLGWVGGWELSGAFPELDVRTNFGADHFTIDRARSETLVDAANFDAQLSPIMGDAVARASGRQRCTIEQYAVRADPPEDFAAGYWELSLPELRIQALRHHLLGARQLLVHALAQSDGWPGDERLLANPRFDFPPSCNFEPWFGHFAALAEESRSVSSFIEGCEPERDVALVYPLHTLWAEGPAHPHRARFGDWARRLAEAGIGFDVVEDRALDAAAVRLAEPGLIQIAGRGYRAVVLAGISILPSPRTERVLDAFVRAGGTLLASRPLPGATAAEGRADGLAERVAALCARAPDDSVPARMPVDLRGSTLRRLEDPGSRTGTLWRWSGRRGAARRLVVLNDGPEDRPLRLDGDPLVLEPGEIACLELEPSGGWRRWEIEPLPPGPVVDPAGRVSLAEGWTLTLPGGDWRAIDPRRGWEQQGLATFSGVATYRCRFDLPPDRAPSGWCLTLPEVACAATARLNGRSLGSRGWPPYRFAVSPELLQAAGNELEIEVANSAANHYYAGTRWQRERQPSGLLAVPQLTRR